MRLPKALELQLREEIVQMEMRQAKPYISLIERLAQEEGREEEAVHLLLRLLTHRFGPVPATVATRLQTLTPTQLEEMVDRALTQTTLAAFTEGLPTIDTGNGQ